jgi:glycosyltransferase involved in cell wall biosynthesis
VSGRTLVTVSGRIDPALAGQVERGLRPRADYLQLAATFDADLMDYGGAVDGDQLRNAGRRIVGDDVTLAWACRRRQGSYDVVFTDGEQIGLPYAALNRFSTRRPRHVMIGHRLTPRKKVLLHQMLRLRDRIDAVVVYSSAQQRFAVEHLGYPPERVVLTPFAVDTEFWHPRVEAQTRDRPMICAVGLELRDYPTMVEAVRGLDVDVIVAAASPWSKRTDSSADVDIPDNVRVASYDHYALRQLYADASFVVVPLVENDFQAGITTILEGMSMAKAVVCTRTTGQQDTIVEDESGRYVPPGDAAALQAEIERLLGDPAEAARLGGNGRAWACKHADTKVYADRLLSIVRQS